ncbi:ABC transporter substrate-binding protein [Candidatus Sumerlaeota bacterium]|nr:ABC transporter substrate-binding protein [Candidatus Sumerlaeota bacterium]
MTTLSLGHSPDPDDAFMFYALAKGLVETGDLRFEHVLQDIETLNRRALNAELDVTALSIHAYAYVADHYVLLPCGASVGERCGPLVVAREQLELSDLRSRCVAVPGTLTTAYLVLRMAVGAFEHIAVPFDEILAAVASGRADAGLIIHEGQLTYAQQSLHKVADLGEWWFGQTGLPLPLGVNAVRKALGQPLVERVARYVRASIDYGLAHRDEALGHALAYARDMDRPLADRFVGMYVNEYTLDLGERGRRAIAVLLDRAHAEGRIPQRVVCEEAIHAR